MADKTDSFGEFTFSTEDVPSRDRLDVLREVIGRTITKLDVEPLTSEKFRIDMNLRALPGLGMAWAKTRTAMRTRRTRELLAQGNDDFVFEIALEGSVRVSQLGRETAYENGMTLVSNAEPKTSVCSPGATILAIALPAAVLAPMIVDLEAAMMSVISLESGPLRLLVDYLVAINNDLVTGTPELRKLIVSHVHDLAALVIGAKSDFADIARGRGVRAARFHKIKRDIAEHIGNRSLSIGAVAARQGISPSYIRKLFDAEGVTFSEFVLSQRIARAHRMLTDPRYAGRTISTIAFEAGFNDLSYFNRTFLRHYHATPSDVREAAKREK